jgi:hypothetical protein
MREFSDAQLQRLESWIRESRSKLNGKEWLLVVEPLLVAGMNIYTYYYVVPERRIIAWLEPVDGYILFQECTAAWHWSHKSMWIFLSILSTNLTCTGLELEAQYW